MAETAVARVKIDPQLLLAKAVEGNASIETLERLVALAKDVREVQAREAWHEAMAEFQRRCPAIKKSKTAEIITARGSYSYNYAPLDQIMETVRPLLGELGLSVFWSSRVEPQRVVVFCRIAHVLGHSENSGEISMPIPDASERGGGNPAQRVGSALTYARRYSLLQVTGLSPEDDDDAASLSGEEKKRKPSGEEVAGGEKSTRKSRNIAFPFPDDVKDKEPKDCTLATLNKYLPIFEKAAADPENKYHIFNERLVTAIKEAIAEKTAKVESPAAPAGGESEIKRDGAPDAQSPGENRTPAGDLPTVDAWAEQYAKAINLGDFLALEHEIQPLWEQYSGPKKTALKFVRDKTKAALTEAAKANAG